MTENDSFTGKWHCTHWYPTPNDDAEDVSECEVIAEQTGDKVIFQSEPMEHDEYLLIKLKIDGDFAHGSWSENASAAGKYDGALYSGLMEMIIDENRNGFKGLWIGIGQDRNKNKPAVYTGRWELTRAD